MIIQELKCTSFRNYADLSIEFPPEGALLEGLNGAGKTNLLESLYVLCTGRSQRSATRSAMIRHRDPYAYIEGCFCREQKGEIAVQRVSFGFSRDRKLVLQRDGSRVTGFSEWFEGRPAVSFSADDLTLVYGSPDDRRRYLDLLASQLDRSYLEALISYRHFLKQRNAVLQSGSFDRTECEIYEERMADTGSELFLKRGRIIKELTPYLADFYREISGGRENASMAYEPSIRADYSSKNDWKNVFYDMLNERRKRDQEAGYSSIGPHRDDISFLLDKKPARTFGSQGQCRSVVLSLKLSSVQCIERIGNNHLIFLIDDAVSELDPQRASRVYPLIERKGQVFIATPTMNSALRPELLRCTVSEGKVYIA